MSKYDTDITVVIDRSGSMGSIANDTIGGFNTFLKKQKEEAGTARFTLAQFDHEYQVIHDNVALPEVPELNNKTFEPRGQTALLDAIGRTINATGDRLSKLPETERPDNVVFVIITDGFENASREFSKEQITQMVEHQTSKYSWDFVYLGANQDAIAVGKSYGFAGGNSLSYAPTSAGTRGSFEALSNHVGAKRKGLRSRSFTADERTGSMKT